MSVSCVVCCVGSGFWDVLITRTEDSYRVCVCVCVYLTSCDLESSTMWQPTYEFVCRTTEKTESCLFYYAIT